MQRFESSFRYRFWHRIATLTAVCALAWLIAGCGEGNDAGDGADHATPATDSRDASADENADRYTVRGRIEAVQNPDGENPKLRIWHERVERFKTRTGRVEPMDAMAMDFPVAEGVAIDELAQGEKVRFTFEVRWEGPQRGYQVTSIEALPADTQLDLEPQTSANNMDPHSETNSETSGDTQDHDHAH